MPIILMAVGALLVVAGIAVVYPPAAIVAAGVMLLLAGVDLTRSDP